MTMGKMLKKRLKEGRYTPVRNIKVTPGQSLRIMREFQEMSQNQLAKASGLPQSAISAMESGRIKIGVERAKVLARALKIHPALIVFPGWKVDEAS